MGKVLVWELLELRCSVITLTWGVIEDSTLAATGNSILDDATGDAILDDAIGDSILEDATGDWILDDAIGDSILDDVAEAPDMGLLDSTLVC